MLKNFSITAAIATITIAANLACAGTSAPPDSGYVAAKTLAQLPHNVLPKEYDISITPDVNTMRIAGTEIVKVHFTEATDKIQFNSSNQKIAHVMLDGEAVESVRSNEDHQLTTIGLKAPASAGPHTLSFAFVGQIDQQLHGLFTQPNVGKNGSKGLFLTAQFEGADTHRIFPCWDDPAFNASYQLKITVPNNWQAWSSMPVTGRDVHGEFTTISYAKTSDLVSQLLEFSSIHPLQSREDYLGKN